MFRLSYKSDAKVMRAAATFDAGDSADSATTKLMGYGFLILYAVLLALVTLKHEMYVDEVQPWLFVRNAHSLLPVIQHLRYEAHPGLWFVLLYGASRISSNIACMQCINFALALTMAWLVLSKSSLPIVNRVLIVFGVTIFFTMGVLARDYMLAGVLLTAAARSFLAKPQRHWLGIALLALAINAHFFAIPIAAGIFVWLYWSCPEMTWKASLAKLKERKFWVSVAILAFALIACYLTVRPAKDLATHLNLAGAGIFDYLILAVGRVWHYYLPFSLDMESSIQNSSLAFPAFKDVFVTLLLWIVALSVLPGRRSRLFMVMSSLLWTAAVVATVRIPLETHASQIVVGYVVALMINRPEDYVGSWFPPYAAQPILLAILSIQVSLCLQYSVKEWFSLFSAGKSTAQWLKAAGLTTRPLVIEPEIAAPTILAYTGISSAYVPGCKCNRTFLLYRVGWDSERQVSPEELQALTSKFGLSPVVISGWELTERDLHHLRLQLLYEPPRAWAYQNENVFVYGVVDHANSESAAAQ